MSVGNRQIKKIISGRWEASGAGAGMRNVMEIKKTSGNKGGKVADKHGGCYYTNQMYVFFMRCGPTVCYDPFSEVCN